MTLPPFPYYGAKARLAPLIAACLPADHRAYVEPFGGSGAVLLAKRPAWLEVFNDLERNVVNFYRVLREQPDELIARIDLTPYARDEYLDAAIVLDEGEQLDPLERARLFYVRATQSFNAAGVSQRTGGWSRPSLARTGGPGAARDTGRKRLHAAARRLENVVIEHTDAVDLIRYYGGDKRTVIYLDPPYLATTRGRPRGYRHELLTEDEHRALADAAHDANATVLLSGYPSPLYDELYGDWHRHDTRVQKATSSRAGARLPVMIEALWSSRPLSVPASLFDGHAGQITLEALAP